MTSIVRLPTGYFPKPDGPGPIALGKVYIGTADTDPTQIANRITVTVAQEDGSSTTIPPTSQPIELNAGGQFQFQGSVVKLTVPGDYSMTVLDANDAQQYYFPFGTEISSGGAVELPAQVSDPSTVADSGFIYTKLVSGVPELFYEDDESNVTQLTDSSGIASPASSTDVPGTRMAFYMSAPPTGWTKITTHNDAMLRVVSGNGGGSGGTVSPISFDIKLNHTHNNPDHTLTVAQLPPHSHRGYRWDFSDPTGSGDIYYLVNVDTPQTTNLDDGFLENTGSGEAFNIGPTEEATLSQTVDLKYVDLILAEKN